MHKTDIFFSASLSSPAKGKSQASPALFGFLSVSALAIAPDISYNEQE